MERITIFECGSPERDLETEWIMLLVAEQEAEMDERQRVSDIGHAAELHISEPDFFDAREATDPHFVTDDVQWWDVLQQEEIDVVFVL